MWCRLRLILPNPGAPHYCHNCLHSAHTAAFLRCAALPVLDSPTLVRHLPDSRSILPTECVSPFAVTQRHLHPPFPPVMSLPLLYPPTLRNGSAALALNLPPDCHISLPYIMVSHTTKEFKPRVLTHHLVSIVVVGCARSRSPSVLSHLPPVYHGISHHQRIQTTRSHASPCQHCRCWMRSL